MLANIFLKISFNTPLAPVMHHYHHHVQLFMFLIWNPLHLTAAAAAAAAAAKLLQLCSTLCDPIDGSPPGSPIPGILQARTLEWVAISFPSGPTSF